MSPARKMSCLRVQNSRRCDVEDRAESSSSITIQEQLHAPKNSLSSPLSSASAQLGYVLQRAHPSFDPIMGMKLECYDLAICTFCNLQFVLRPCNSGASEKWRERRSSSLLGMERARYRGLAARSSVDFMRFRPRQLVPSFFWSTNLWNSMG